MNELLARLQSHPAAGMVIVTVVILVALAVAVLAWLSVRAAVRPAACRVRGWFAGVRYHLFGAGRRKVGPALTILDEARALVGSPAAPNVVWDDAETGQLDAAFARALAEAREEQLTGELAAFAEAPAPACADNCQTMVHTGSLQPLPPDRGMRTWWEQDRPVQTVGLPPWDVVEDPGFNPSQEHGVRARVPRDRPLIEAAGAPSAPTVALPDPVEPAKPSQSRDRQHLPGPAHGAQGEPATAHAVADETRRAGKARRSLARRYWSGLLGHDPLSLVIPGRTASPAPEPVAKAGQPVRDGQHLPGQDGRESDARVLTGEVTHGPPPDDAPTIVVNISVVSITVQAGDYDYDALQFINDLKARYAAEHQSLRAWSAEIEAYAEPEPVLALEGSVS